MRQRKRQVTDKATICAMLDAMDTIHVAMHDEPFPYIVPLNFGYHWEDKLTFYFHCAHEGYKLELLHRNPHVCVNASSFVSYAGASVKGHLHDYRSVTARGVWRRNSNRIRRSLFTPTSGCLRTICATRRKCTQRR
ncbi:MAG: pyridoxamine 5'-phosphate oxidase family protein [Christensenellales bacterium]